MSEEKKTNPLAKYQEEKKKQKAQEGAKSFDPNKTYIFELIQKSGTARNVLVSNKCRINDGGKLRDIRYIPTEDSIFMDEQGEYDENQYPLEPIVFYKDTLKTKGDQRLVEFLMTHDGNKDNKNRISRKDPIFQLANKDIVLQRESEELELKFKAETLIRESSIDDIKCVAKVVFGIKQEDELEVKNRLIKLAANQPLRVVQNMGNPQVKRKYDIITAFDKGILTTNVKHGVISWEETGVDVVSIKPNEEKEETLLKYSFTKDGEEFYKVLKTKLV